MTITQTAYHYFDFACSVLREYYSGLSLRAAIRRVGVILARGGGR